MKYFVLAITQLYNFCEQKQKDIVELTAVTKVFLF